MSLQETKLNKESVDVLARMAQEMDGWECLRYNLFHYIDSMGKSKPKTLQKLRACLKKWEKLVFFQDPFQLLSSELCKENDIHALLQVKQSVGIPNRVIRANLCEQMTRRVQRGNSIAIILDDMSRVSSQEPILEHIKSCASEQIPSVKKWESEPSQSEIQQILDSLTQSLQFHINGGQKNPSQGAKEQVDRVIDTSIKAMEEYGYIKIFQREDGNEGLTYSFPNDFMVQCLQSLLTEYLSDVADNLKKHELRWSHSLLANKVRQCNHHLSLLKTSVESAGNYHRMNILSGAIDALHKVKNKKDAFSASEHSNSLFNAIYLKSERDGSRSRSSSSDSSRRGSVISVSSDSSFVSKSRYRSRSRTPSEASCSMSEPDCSEEPIINPVMEHHSASNIESVSLSQSLKHKRQISSSSDNDSLSRQPVDKKARFEITMPDKRREEKDLVYQTNLVKKLIGLNLHKSSDASVVKAKSNVSEDRKDKEFEQLINCMQTLKVNDISNVPQCIMIETVIFITALDKMGESKPKSLKALRNSLLPVCKFMYVLNPKILPTLNLKPHAGQQLRLRRPKKTSGAVPIGHFNVLEYVRLNSDGITEKPIRRNPKMDFSKFFKDKMKSEAFDEKSKELPLGNGENIALEKRKEKDFLYDCLEKAVKHRVKKLGTTMVLVKENESDIYQQNFKPWIENLTSDRKRQQFYSRKEMYETIVKLCIVTKNLNVDQFLELLQRENLITVNLDETIEYSSHFESDISAMDITGMKSYREDVQKKAQSLFARMKSKNIVDAHIECTDGNMDVN